MTDNQRGLEMRQDVIRSRETGALTFVIMAENKMIDDQTITENHDLFCIWDENWSGEAGSIVKNGGVLFRSICDVGPGEHTCPSTTPSMWELVGDPSGEWPLWVKVLGVYDAYAQNDQVTHNGMRWISSVDSNAWEPGVFGWTQVGDQAELVTLEEEST